MSSNQGFDFTNINPADLTKNTATGSEVPGTVRSFVGVKVSDLFTMINASTADVQAKLAQIRSRQSSIGVGDMFEMQMQMNHLSQLSEMAGAVVSAMNQTTQSFAQKIK